MKDLSLNLILESYFDRIKNKNVSFVAAAVGDGSIVGVSDYRPSPGVLLAWCAVYATP